MSDDKDLTPTDFLAYMIYRAKEESKGAQIWTRWTCLDEPIREQYKSEIMQQYDEWKRGELEAKARREKLLND